MSRRVVVGGVALVVVLGSLGWASAQRPGGPTPAAAGGPALEVGRIYAFALPPSGGREELEGTVVEPPRGEWVKVQARGEALTHWVNLNTVSVVTPLGHGE